VTWRTVTLLAGLVALVGLIAAPSVVERIHYARVRGELAAIRDAARVSELAPVGKLFTSLARIIGPAVVNVTATRRAGQPADETMHLRTRDGESFTDVDVGSGVIVAADGLIVTNDHVVDDAESIAVTLADGRRFTATVVGHDPKTDLAVLRIDATGLPAATWGDSDGLEVGEMVWAIGNPYGLDRTLTYGIVSAVGRRAYYGDTLHDFLQTDAAINPGNSGGPLVDVHGSVVGITIGVMSATAKGIGFAIPSNAARKVVEALVARRPVESGYIGVVTAEPPAGYSTLPGALLVRTVVAGGPADVAGLQPGDLLLSFDGERPDDPTDLAFRILHAEVGADVAVEILRGDRRRTLAVRVGRAP
jgi:S1-C subfamily serine protease